MASERPHKIGFIGAYAPDWQELSNVHPRIAACFVLTFALLILADLSLILKSIEFGRGQQSLHAALTQIDTESAAAEDATKRNLSAADLGLARREALLARELHLVVDCDKGVMYLRRDGLILREMPVSLGREVTAATQVAAGSQAIAGSQADLGSQAEAAPRAVLLGRHVVVSVMDGTSPGRMPESGQSLPADRVLSGRSGPLAVLLDRGAVITPEPGSDPAHDAGLPPGSIRVATADLEAIKAVLQPGMKVYFY